MEHNPGRGPEPGEILVDEAGNVNIGLPTAVSFAEAPPPNQPLPALNSQCEANGDLRMMLDLTGGGSADDIISGRADIEVVTLYWRNATVTARVGTIREWMAR